MNTEGLIINANNVALVKTICRICAEYLCRGKWFVADDHYRES